MWLLQLVPFSFHVDIIDALYITQLPSSHVRFFVLDLLNSTFSLPLLNVLHVSSPGLHLPLVTHCET